MSSAAQGRRQATFEHVQLLGLPAHIAGALTERHRATQRRQGLRAANTELREWRERYDRTARRLPLDAGEDRVRAWADARARECAGLAAGEADLMAAYALLRNYANGFAIQPAPAPARGSPYGAVARMCDPQWWRRRMRTQHARECEANARALGLVGRAGNTYLTRAALDRWLDRQRLNARMLDETVVVDDESGREIALTQAVAASVANPTLRRLELMTRIRGFEEVASARGDRGVFVTWTAPAAMHARHSRTGRVLEGAQRTPRDVARYLMRQWAKARAALKRQRIGVYGVRVSEPHQDGTPHMHFLVFCAPENLGTVRAILRGYALEHAPDERGAARNRFRATDMDPARGGAAAYCAKYIGKGIDGHALDAGAALGTDGDRVAMDAQETALRVRAWASLWGIRQFQFIGSPPVTVWRDLRRLDGDIYHASAAAERARAAADAGDWRGYVEAMAGAPVRLLAVEDGTNRYGEPARRYVLDCGGVHIDAHPVRWRLEWRPQSGKPRIEPMAAADLLRPRPGYAGRIELPALDAPLYEPRASAAPWTRANNCTGETDARAVSHRAGVVVDRRDPRLGLDGAAGRGAARLGAGGVGACARAAPPG